MNTPQPPFVKPCEKLQCEDGRTIRDRVWCRLNLAPAGLARELQIQYLPEACRAFEAAERDRCIARYKSYQPCWGVPDDAGRNTCARAVLKLGNRVTPSDREKVFAMIIFRFYNLEKHAEDLTYKGADLARVTEFVSFIQDKKIAFYGAKNKAERRQIILNVREEWQRFYNDVRGQLQ